MSSEEILKLILKESDTREVKSFVTEDGVQVFTIGKPNIQRLAELLVNIYKI